MCVLGIPFVSLTSSLGPETATWRASDEAHTDDEVFELVQSVSTAEAGLSLDVPLDLFDFSLPLAPIGPIGRSRSVTSPGLGRESPAFTRVNRAVSWDLPLDFFVVAGFPRVEMSPGRSPGLAQAAKRVQSPVSAPFLVIFPSDEGTVGAPSPISLYGRRASVGASPRGLSDSPIFRGRWDERIMDLVARAESAITADLLDHMLSFQLVPFSAASHGVSLAQLEAVVTEIMTVKGEKGGSMSRTAGAFRESERITVFSRAAAEVLVDLANAKDASVDSFRRGAPYIRAFTSLARAVGLDTTFFDNHSALVDRVMDPPAVGLPKPVPDGLAGRESERILLAFSTITAYTSTGPKRAAYPEFLSALELMTSFFAGSLPGRAEQLRASPDWHALQSALVAFCHSTAEDILEAFALELDEDELAEPRVTRIGIDIVALCRSHVSLEARLFTSFPRLLQSGIGSTPSFPDGDVMFSVPQGPDLVPALVASMRTFGKLELMNEVFVEFQGSAAMGYDGLRREWLSQIISAMSAVDFGLFEFSDDSHTFLKPVAGAAADERLRVFGRMLGLSLRYGVTAGVRLAPSCLRQIVKRSAPKPGEAEAMLAVEDPALLKSLKKLDLIEDADEIARLGLELSGGVVVRTRDELTRFIAQKKREAVVESTRSGMTQIAAGMADTVRLVILESLTVAELSTLLVGDDEVDVADLLASTSWALGRRGMMSSAYTPEQVEWFREILSSLDQEEISRFLAFVSGSPRAPIGGFLADPDHDRSWLHLVVDPTMRVDQWPVAQTCFVILRVPLYESVEDMRAKLLKAIELGTTIDLPF